MCTHTHTRTGNGTWYSTTFYFWVPPAAFSMLWFVCSQRFFGNHWLPSWHVEQIQNLIYFQWHCNPLDSHWQTSMFLHCRPKNRPTPKLTNYHDKEYALIFQSRLRWHCPTPKKLLAAKTKKKPRCYILYKSAKQENNTTTRQIPFFLPTTIY